MFQTFLNSFTLQNFGSSATASSINVLSAGLHLPLDSASHLIQLLDNENRSLSIDIQCHTDVISALTIRRNAVLTCLQALHHLLDGSSSTCAS